MLSEQQYKKYVQFSFRVVLFFFFVKQLPACPVTACVERYESSETFVLQLVVIFEE